MESNWSVQVVFQFLGAWFLFSSLFALALARAIRLGQRSAACVVEYEPRSSGVLPRLDRTSEHWPAYVEEFEREVRSSSADLEEADTEPVRKVAR